ncbi:interleukin-32 isoform X1 [Equus przewalskii]|uniref:Interleukin-32 isoform X1 n=1 Tax=Equus przewalskii TaxID=9798 RepID=A0ABM2EV90_EQUPR|nr:PREDICTED: interleukin-32 isoform X1 [Equus przewalskii]XP_008519372.1 PREDICTED: interleukin-32 isoform X1 [Equus przewalskii]
MGYPKTSREDNERWKIRFHSTLDRWLDDIEVQSQGEEQVCQCAPTPCSRNLGGGVVTMTMRRKNVPPQVDLGLEDLEEKFSENILDAVEEHHQKNNSESAPLLPDVKPRLRRRAQKSSVLNPEPEGPGILQVEALEAPEPEESFWVRAWRSFMGMLQRLKQRWQAVLAWVREKVAAGWQALCSVAQSINSVLESFCSYMAGLFRYHIQV